MLVAFVSLRVFTLRLGSRELYPSEKYLKYITNASHQAPHLESFTIHLGSRYTLRYKRVNENWVVCGEVEHP
jgi:hypothetical protein